MVDDQDEIIEKILTIKLKRINELNTRLNDSLQRERVAASQACQMVIFHSQDTRDFLIPCLWGLNPEENKFQIYKDYKAMKSTSKNSCCSIM